MDILIFVNRHGGLAFLFVYGKFWVPESQSDVNVFKVYFFKSS